MVKYLNATMFIVCQELLFWNTYINKKVW